MVYENNLYNRILIKIDLKNDHLGPSEGSKNLGPASVNPTFVLLWREMSTRDAVIENDCELHGDNFICID